MLRHPFNLYAALVAASLLAAPWTSAVVAQGPAPYAISAASWLGGDLDTDRICGARI